MKTYSFSQLKKHYLKDPEIKRLYDELGPEYELTALMIERRIKTGLTQTALAKRLGTKQSSIARFESGNYNPSLQFLYKMARAMDAELIVKVKA